MDFGFEKIQLSRALRYILKRQVPSPTSCFEMGARPHFKAPVGLATHTLHKNAIYDKVNSSKPFGKKTFVIACVIRLQ